MSVLELPVRCWIRRVRQGRNSLSRFTKASLTFRYLSQMSTQKSLAYYLEVVLEKASRTTRIS